MNSVSKLSNISKVLSNISKVSRCYTGNNSEIRWVVGLGDGAG